MTPEERFEHIETVLVRIAEAHLELETAQINAQKAHERHVEESRERSKAIDEKIANLTILVDRLIERDLQ
jgi:predicted metalloenzyme YecM